MWQARAKNMFLVKIGVAGKEPVSLFVLPCTYIGTYDGTPVSKLTLTHRERAMHTATAAAAVLLLCLAPSLALHGAVLHHRRLAVLAMCCELRLHSNGHVFRRGEVVLCGRRQRVP